MNATKKIRQKAKTVFRRNKYFHGLSKNTNARTKLPFSYSSSPIVLKTQRNFSNISRVTGLIRYKISGINDGFFLFYLKTKLEFSL